MYGLDVLGAAAAAGEVSVPVALDLAMAEGEPASAHDGPAPPASAWRVAPRSAAGGPRVPRPTVTSLAQELAPLRALLASQQDAVRRPDLDGGTSSLAFSRVPPPPAAPAAPPGLAPRLSPEPALGADVIKAAQRAGVSDADLHRVADIARQPPRRMQGRPGAVEVRDGPEDEPPQPAETDFFSQLSRVITAGFEAGAGCRPPWAVADPLDHLLPGPSSGLWERGDRSGTAV